MKKVGLSLLIFSWVNLLLGQSPYQFSLRQELAWLIPSHGLIGTTTFLTTRLDPLSEMEILQLDARDIGNFDRAATENYSEAAATRSDVLIFGSYALAAGAGAYAVAKQDNKGKQFLQLALLGWETNAVTFAGTDLVKIGVGRIRPFVYNPDAPLEAKQEANAQKSFFSGHTSITAANCFFLAKVLSDYFPEKKWTRWVWVGAALLPAWTARERVAAGKHFPTDVIAGYTWGALCGFFVPHLHKKSLGKNLRISPVAGSVHGLSLRLTF
ncbi:MAG: phosphatase PAP2 family protein [Bacteroidota bacterium]